jgi:guanylate kinase
MKNALLNIDLYAAAIVQKRVKKKSRKIFIETREKSFA